MASTFSFGFSGDDIDIDESDLNDVQEQAAPVTNTGDALPALVMEKKHDMGEWVSLHSLYSVYIFVYAGGAFLQARIFGPSLDIRKYNPFHVADYPSYKLFHLKYHITDSLSPHLKMKVEKSHLLGARSLTSAHSSWQRTTRSKRVMKS